MRRILVEKARRKRRRKHGGSRARIALDQVEVAAPEAPDDLLAPQEAARMLGTTVRWVWRHARELGAVRVSKRRLRLSRRRVMRWLDARRTAS